MFDLMTMMTATYLMALSGKKIHAEQSLNEKEGLYSLQALIQPISLRFKYHFESSRQTNKLDKVFFLRGIKSLASQLTAAFPA